LVTTLLLVTFGILEHDVFLFPLGIAYMGYGVLRAAFLGLMSEPDEDADAEIAGPIMIPDGGRASDAFEEDEGEGDLPRGGSLG
jgi:hypothetical protein